MQYFSLFLLCALAALALASPAYDHQIENHQRELEAIWEPAGEITQEHVERFKRATCDLLSFSSQWITPNDAGCAAHCLIKGFKGGRCKDRICHCRN